MRLPQMVRAVIPNNSIPINAAGGIVYRFKDEILEVLLIYRNEYWDIPKGKLEKGETIPMCAVREVSEEVGSSLPSIVADIGITNHSYVQKKKSFYKTTYWFAMIFTSVETLVPQTEEGIEKIEWTPIDEAEKMVGFDNLRIVLSRFKSLMLG